MRTSNPKIIQAAFDTKFKAISTNIDQALNEVGERGTNYLKLNTPEITGHLRQSMSYTVGSKVYRPLGHEDNVTASGDKETVYIGTNVIYAPSVEFLAKNNSQGFMLRAYKHTKKQAKKIFKQAMQEGMKK